MTTKKIITSVFISLTHLTVNAQEVSQALNKVIETYGGKWPKTLSFTQTTTLFSPTGETKQTWYEAGSLPEKFRIDFNREKGNTVIFNNGKEYYFRENKLTRTGPIHNPLIYILGGMYFDSKDSVEQKLKNLGVDTKTESAGLWKGKNVLIVGALTGDTTKTQLWFDKKDLYLVRFLQNEGKDKMDIHFSGQKKIGNTWHEMIVDVYQNGKMRQKEEYMDFRTNVKLDDGIFDPDKFGSIHWLK